MAHLSVEPVTTRRQRRQFLTLPWRLYSDDPLWIPPIRRNQEELAGFRRHPFYLRAEIQCFLALRNHRPVGRVAAIVNHAHNERYQEKCGFFGFFEAIDDERVARQLFDAAGQWLADRDIHAIRGPTNPSLNYECGLLVEGFDEPPTFMMTYNPPYYASLVESCGFAKTQDLYAFTAGPDMLGNLEPRVQKIVDGAAKRYKLTLRHLDMGKFADDLKAFMNIYNRSLVDTWGFVPLSDEEMSHIGKTLQHLIVPELTCLAEKDGQVIGAMFGVLDYNPRIKRSNGRLLPWDVARLLVNRRQIKKVRLVSTNVAPEFHRFGVGPAMTCHLRESILDWGIEVAEFSWVLESNHLSRATLENTGMARTRTYRLYDRGSPK